MDHAKIAAVWLSIEPLLPLCIHEDGHFTWYDDDNTEYTCGDDTWPVTPLTTPAALWRLIPLNIEIRAGAVYSDGELAFDIPARARCYELDDDVIATLSIEVQSRVALLRLVVKGEQLKSVDYSALPNVQRLIDMHEHGINLQRPENYDEVAKTVGVELGRWLLSTSDSLERQTLFKQVQHLLYILRAYRITPEGYKYPNGSACIPFNLYERLYTRSKPITPTPVLAEFTNVCSEFKLYCREGHWLAEAIFKHVHFQVECGGVALDVLRELATKMSDSLTSALESVKDTRTAQSMKAIIALGA